MQSTILSDILLLRTCKFASLVLFIPRKDRRTAGVLARLSTRQTQWTDAYKKLNPQARLSMLAPGNNGGMPESFSGLDVRVANPIRVLALTMNPYTPEYRCSPRRLKERVPAAPILLSSPPPPDFQIAQATVPMGIDEATFPCLDDAQSNKR